MHKLYFVLSIILAGLVGSLISGVWRILFPEAPIWPSWILAACAGFGIGKIYTALDRK